MGHEDFVMITAIVSSVLLQLTNVLPNVPSWLPAIAAGLYKYSVDIKREYDKRNGGGGGKVVVIKSGSIEIVTDKVEVRPE